jgi:DNA primase
MNNEAEFEKFVEELKSKASLIEVIEALSTMRFQQRRVGRFVYALHPDSFAVDDDWGIYTWFAQAGTGGHQYETGDVFHWMERYANLDFWAACEWLATRYGVSIPKRQPMTATDKKHKSRMEMYDIACKWFEAELWSSPAALDYCHRRGWTDETIRRSRLGFAPGFARLQDLKGTFAMNEVNQNDPAAVSISGRRGGVATWLKDFEITDFSDDWVTNDYIPGLATGIRLVYPHLWRGRVTYFSARNLEVGADGVIVNRPEKDANGDHHPKSWNQPRCLVGERLRYYNFCFTRGAENCLVVEGQPDAISAAQLGIAAAALAGVAPDEGMAGLMRQYQIKRVFMGLDGDAVGQKNQVKAATVFGPMTRMVTWPAQETTATDEVIEENADAVAEES